LRQSLLWKLLGVNVLVIAFVISVVWLAINYLAAAYFMTLMEKYHISPAASHQMFVSAVHRYLIWASIAAFVLALALSVFLMRRLLGPLTKMTGTAQRIAEGDYTGEVPVVSSDEVGRLSEAFNRMSASLRHTEQLRKKMVIDVAHELRTPLTNIRGYLEALADNVLTPSRETLLLLQEETLRLANLVEDIMRLARADAARADLHRAEIEADSAVSQMLDAFRPQLDARRIIVKVDVKQRGIRLSADPEKLSQVLTNLFQNALQYTPSGGELKITIDFYGQASGTARPTDGRRLHSLSSGWFSAPRTGRGNLSSSHSEREGEAGYPLAGGALPGEGANRAPGIDRTPEEALFVFANTCGELEDRDLPFIFERFYRGEKSRSREHGGAGIGLAIVKELVEAHGGHVGAELAQGYVRIWFSLPLMMR
jgi:two-component system sensor histidine kinase BaeS